MGCIAPVFVQLHASISSSYRMETGLLSRGGIVGRGPRFVFACLSGELSLIKVDEAF